MNRLISGDLIAGSIALAIFGCVFALSPAVGGSLSMTLPSEGRKPGQPLILYTTAKHSAGDREFVYFMLIRPPEPQDSGPQYSMSAGGSYSGDLKATSISPTRIAATGPISPLRQSASTEQPAGHHAATTTRPDPAAIRRVSPPMSPVGRTG